MCICGKVGDHLSPLSTFIQVIQSAHTEPHLCCLPFSFLSHPRHRNLLKLLRDVCPRQTLTPVYAYLIAFSASATGADIRQSRAAQCKGLGIEHGFFTHLEGVQSERLIGLQPVRGGLIEGRIPMILLTKIEEAPCDPHIRTRCT